MTATIPERFLHAPPCPQSRSDVWVSASDGPYWEPILPCTCSPEASEPSPQQEKEDEPRDVDEPAESEEPVTREAVAAGGWCAPSDTAYPLFALPEVRVERGGISFTAPPRIKPLEEWSKKELRAEVETLRRALDLQRERAERSARLRRNAERKVKRLLKIIGRIA